MQSGSASRTSLTSTSTMICSPSLPPPSKNFLIPQAPMPDFSSCAKKLGASFNNLNLLVEALTHRSYLNEHPEYTGSHNERLEFLGDAVLELAVTDFLFKKFPAKPEGELTSYRAALVNTVSLAQSSQALGAG